MLVFADDAALARLVIAATQRRAHVYRLEAFRSRGRGHARAASTCYPADQVHHRRRYSMPHFAAPRRGPKPDRRPALELLAASRDGCTEAIMLAHGFTVAQMVELVRAGLASATAECIVAWRARDGGRPRADHGSGTAGRECARIIREKASPGPTLAVGECLSKRTRIINQDCARRFS
jgi:hypothetical protein